MALLKRWKYQLPEKSTTWKLKITVLSQKLIMFGGLVNKYTVLLRRLLHSFSWHVRRKRKHYKHGLQRENVQREDEIILQTLLGKGAQDIILIHNTVYLRDQYINDGEKKKQKQSENTFSHVCVQFHFPFCDNAAHNDLKLQTEHC